MIVRGCEIRYVRVMRAVRNLLLSLVVLAFAGFGLAPRAHAAQITWQFTDPTSVITGHGVVQNSASSGTISGFAAANSFAAVSLLNGANCATVGLACANNQVALVVDSNYATSQAQQRNGLGGLVLNFNPNLNLGLLTVAYQTGIAPSVTPVISLNAVTLPNAQSTTDLTTFDIGITWALGTTTPTLWGNATTNATTFRSVLMFTYGSNPAVGIAPNSFDFRNVGNTVQFAAALTNLRCTGALSGCNTPNVRYDLASIPEPASIAVLATGLIGLAALRRRRLV